MAGLKVQPIALGDHGKDEHRLRHRKCRTDANALTGSEWNIGEARTREYALGRKSLRIETIRVFPKRRLAVQQPRNDQNQGACWNSMTKNMVGDDRLARHGVRWRVEPH